MRNSNHIHIPDVRTFAFHSRAAEILLNQPERVMEVYETLKHWTTLEGTQAQAWAEKWFELLEGLEIDEVAALITKKDETMDFYRKSSPFACLLSEEERLDILRKHSFNHDISNR